MSKGHDPSERLDKLDYELLADFRYALRRFLRFSEEAAREAGVEPQQHQALLALKGFSGGNRVTVGDLAERLQVRHHSAVGLVNRLVALGLMARAAAPEDRRRVYLSLTPAGEAVLERLAEASRSELRRAAPELVHLLQRIVQTTG